MIILNRIFIIFLTGTCLGSLCYAQTIPPKPIYDEFEYRNIIKINTLSPFAGVINFHFETRHTTNASSQLEVFVFTGALFGQVTPYKGAGVTYNYRYFIKGNYPQGFYVQPFGRFQKYNYVGSQNPTVSSGTQNYENVAVFGLGMVFGYQTFFTKRFSFELFAGPVYNFAYADGARASGMDIGPPLNGGWVRLGTTIGYAF